MPNIAGQVVVITGASSGIGEATARHLATKGAKVFLGARRKQRLEAIVAEIERAGGQAGAMPVDVTKRSDVEAFVQGAIHNRLRNRATGRRRHQRDPPAPDRAGAMKERMRPVARGAGCAGTDAGHR